jgi:hypothetical protein
LGSPRAEHRACFRARWLHSVQPFPERTVRFIPSCSRSSSEFLRSLSRPVPYRDQADCQGLFPLRDITGCVHSTRGFPSPRYVPSAGILNLSTAFSASGSAGLFHPAAASRDICSFRGLPSQRSCRFPHRKRAAPLPLFAGRSPEQVPESTIRRPRLRGLHPRRARASESW